MNMRFPMLINHKINSAIILREPSNILTYMNIKAKNTWYTMATDLANQVLDTQF